MGHFKKLILKLNTIFDWLLDFFAILAGIILCFITICICTAILSRYLFNRPLGWVVEISEYGLVYITFLVAAWVLKGDGHVKVDIVFNRLKPGTQCLTNFGTSFTIMIVCLLVTFYGIKVTWNLFNIGYFTPTVLELPKFVISLIIPLGFFSLFIESARKAVGHLKDLKVSRYQEKIGEIVCRVEDVR